MQLNKVVWKEKKERQRDNEDQKEWESDVRKKLFTVFPIVSNDPVQYLTHVQWLK